MAKRFVVFMLSLFILVVLVNHKRILGYFYPIKFDTYVEQYSKQNNLDSLLVYSLIRTESKFNHEAESHKGAIGLMQVIPQTGNYISKLLGDKKFNPAMLLDPETNIKYGCFYLSKLYKDFNNDLNCVLAAYNGGEGNVRKWMKESADGKKYLDIENIPFKETRNYIDKVKKTYLVYKYLYTR